MILTGPEIVRRIGEGSIVITPFNKDRVNPNSVNLTLAPELKIYDHGIIDTRRRPKTTPFMISPDGYTLSPGTLYLASTVEWTETYHLVPRIDGRSSFGRSGLFIHVTAGFGDVGFRGRFTLELVCVQPVVIYPYQEICQISYHTITGEEQQYAGRYQNQEGVEPHRLWQDGA